MSKTLCLFLFAAALWGQEFEVVSVKPNKTNSNHSSSHSDAGMLRADNMSLRSMIVQAYGMKDYQVEGPEWLRTEKYDVAAKFPEALPKDREKYRAGLQAMMRKMLEERFKLVTHRDQKMFAVYGLVVDKKGIRAKEVPNTGSHMDTNDQHFEGSGVTMAAFAEWLSRRVDRPVVDMTGLTAAYEFTLDWPREPDAVDPPIIGIIQDKLGLKLESRKTQLEILIVDKAERVPTEN